MSGYDWKTTCVTLNIFVSANVGTILAMLNVSAILEDIVDASNTPCRPGEVEATVELTTYLAAGASGLLLVHAPTPTEVTVDVVASGGTLCV